MRFPPVCNKAGHLFDLLRYRKPLFAKNSAQVKWQKFLQWSQSVTLFLRGKGRLGYITGETKSPDVSDPGYRQWDVENSMVQVCLINSMDVDIGRTYLFLPSANELWEAVIKPTLTLEMRLKSLKSSHDYLTRSKEVIR